MDLVIAKNSRVQLIEKENKTVVSSSSEISEKYVYFWSQVLVYTLKIIHFLTHFISNILYNLIKLTCKYRVFFA